MSARPPAGADGDAADPVDRVTEVVAEALELAGDARRAFLDRACGGDRALRAEVDSLIAEHELAETEFLAVPAPARISHPGASTFAGTSTRTGGGAWYRSGTPDPMPERIGPYRIVDRLGEGGMATVYLAEQDEPVHRRVALKVIRALHRPRAREWFAAECQALARLNHPNVAALYEVGATSEDEGGRPYVAMEWVEGEHVTDWCDARRLDLATRLRLFAGVCGGIRHAHEKGVLHCDLKPSNVLVTEVDGRAVAKVIDFGIARALDEPLTGQVDDVTGEMFLGSPLYVSPEAARRGGRKSLDARSDVYSLGLILYELLAGVLPFDLGERGVWTFLQELSERDPPAPSARLRGLRPERAAKLAARRGLDPRRHVRALSGDLDAIAVKAAARDPAERYGSPAELLADLERHARHRPVEARSGSTPYVLGRFLRRHAGAAVSAVLLVAALAGGLVARTVEAQRANAEAERARAALAEAEQVRDFVIGLFEAADPDRVAGDTITARELLDQGAERLRDELADRPLVRARFLHTIGVIDKNLGLFPAAEELLAEALELRAAGLPAGHPEVLASRAELAVVYRHQGRLDEAEPLLADVLAARLAAPDAAPELIANAYNDVGNLHWNQQRYDEAEAAHRAALRIRERIPGLVSEEAASANNLGVLLLSRHRYAEARPFLQRAMEGFRAALGPEHPRVAAAINNLGLVERNLDTWERAEGLFREAFAIWKAAYGEEHPHPMLAGRNIVDELLRKHRWQEAVAEARALAAAAERIEGDAVGLAGVLRQVGRAERLAGERETAVSTLRRAVALAEEGLGPDHPETLSSRHGLALALSADGARDEAAAVLEAVAAIQDRSLPADHPSRLRTEAGLGVVATADGRHADAEAHHRRTADANRRRLGEDHPTTATSLHDLGAAVAAQGRDDEAAALLSRALAARRAVYGPAHPYAAETAHELALVERRRGEADRARELLEQAVAVRRAAYPPDDPDLRASLDALASLPSP